MHVHAPCARVCGIRVHACMCMPVCAPACVHGTHTHAHVHEYVRACFTSQGLLRILVATETVAMGLNLPARTVVFTSASKFDGHGQRQYAATEYTQMSGRAGRRGLDTAGHSVLLLSHWMDRSEGEAMLSRRFDDLRSAFTLRFSSLLKLVRAHPRVPLPWPPVHVACACPP